jgi:hypothetical protein
LHGGWCMVHDGYMHAHCIVCMYACMHACMYVCMCVCLYVHMARAWKPCVTLMYVRMYAFAAVVGISRSTPIHMCMCMWSMYMDGHADMHRWVRRHPHVDMHACVCACACGHMVLMVAPPCFPCDPVPHHLQIKSTDDLSCMWMNEWQKSTSARHVVWLGFARCQLQPVNHPINSADYRQKQHVYAQ